VFFTPVGFCVRHVPACQCTTVFIVFRSFAQRVFAEGFRTRKMSLPPIVGGYSREVFTDHQDLESYQCGICSLICKDTVKLTGCGHSFCRECIGRWVVSGHNTCPYCRATFLGHADMKSVDLDPVLMLQVQCDNQGCDWIGALGNRGHHKREECAQEDRRIACPYCQFYGETKDYRVHECAELKEECVICRNLLEKLCITCEAETTPAASSRAMMGSPSSEHEHGLTVSVCKHAKQACDHQYHDHCLTRWIRKRNSCPLCDLPVVAPSC
jgi:hypothetical protein